MGISYSGVFDYNPFSFKKRSMPSIPPRSIKFRNNGNSKICVISFPPDKDRDGGLSNRSVDKSWSEDSTTLVSRTYNYNVTFPKLPVMQFWSKEQNVDRFSNFQNSIISTNIYNDPEGDTTSPGKWKPLINIKGARQRCLNDKSMPPQRTDSTLELRLFLEDISLLKFMVEFSSEIKLIMYIICWVDIQHFKSLHCDGFEHQRSTASLIIDKYMKVGSSNYLNMEGLEQKRLEYRKLVDIHEEYEAALNSDMFDEIQLHCFIMVYENIWLAFRADKVYETAINSLKSSYNRVEPDDFHFYEELGAGGYGYVVHARKVSTGKHYAIKIQKKRGLLEIFSDCPQRVTYERQAMSRCNHPFVIRLDYAFQTSDFVFMVMELGTAGSLTDAKKGFEKQRIPELCVRFYAAEIATGLMHMHQMGFLHKDLKPDNVVLMSNGHIKLVDLGGVVDRHAKRLKPSVERERAPSLLKDFSVEAVESLESVDSEDFSRPSDTKNFIGTPGYMAPEIVRLYRDKMESAGAVDWWGLGIIMVELLMGYNPLRKLAVDCFVDNNILPEPYVVMMDKLKSAPHVSDQALNVITQFLAVNPDKRLGSGRHGFYNIKKHTFFEHLDWWALGQLELKPPHIPKSTVKMERRHESFDSMVHQIGRNLRRGFEYVTVAQNALFDDWDYVAPDAIRIELGAELQEYLDS